MTETFNRSMSVLQNTIHRSTDSQLLQMVVDGKPGMSLVYVVDELRQRLAQLREAQRIISLYQADAIEEAGGIV